MAPCGKDCTTTCLGTLYDIMAQIISILDVTTDVIVCIQYYQRDRMVFFGISITILILALIAYDIAFFINFCDESSNGKKLALFLFMLPFTPFVPYILYFTADDTSFVSRCLERKCCCFDLYVRDRNSTSDNVSKLRQFMETKIIKHLGFIIEALVEGLLYKNTEITNSEHIYS